MSYVKTHDVYLYPAGPGIVCHECKLRNGASNSLVLKTRLAAIDHLREHVEFGHEVSAESFCRLWKEREEKGNDAEDWRPK